MSRPGDLVPAHSAAVFRIVFGVVSLFVVFRFFSNGWIDALFIAPEIHYPYHGLEWVRPWPGIGMYLHFAVLGIAAAGIAVGWRYRVCAVVFAFGLAYVELIDQTLYLNHYYWLALSAGVMAVLPLHRAWSLDARRRRLEPIVPRLVVWVLRGQVAMVYLFAGIAKVGHDWLLRGQPLATWLPARGELPIVGPLLGMHETAVVLSWAGALFDLTIVGWLLWRRSRPVAYAVLVGFHVATWLLFPSIGAFPWLMIGVSLVFFPPDWPLRARARQAPPIAPARVSPLAVAAVAVYAAVMLVIPLRHLADPGDVLWTGEGYAFSWRVMLTEKAGSVAFLVTDRTTGERWVEELPAALTARQRDVVATSPALIVDTARLIAAAHLESGREVAVSADAYLSFNGRRSVRIIDPGVDLAGDDLGPSWTIASPG